MIILADVPSGIVDFKFTIGNIITLLSLIGTAIGFFFKLKYGLQRLQEKDAEQAIAIANNAKVTEALDKNGTTSFVQFRQNCEKQLDLSDTRLSKIEENIVPKIEKIMVQLETVLKWIDRQDNMHSKN